MMRSWSGDGELRALETMEQCGKNWILIGLLLTFVANVFPDLEVKYQGRGSQYSLGRSLRSRIGSPRHRFHFRNRELNQHSREL